MLAPALLPGLTTGYRPPRGRRTRILRGFGLPTISLSDPPLGGDGRHGVSPSNPVLTYDRYQTAQRMRKTMGGRATKVPLTDGERSGPASGTTSAEPSRTQRSGSAPTRASSNTRTSKRLGTSHIEKGTFQIVANGVLKKIRNTSGGKRIRGSEQLSELMDSLSI